MNREDVISKINLAMHSGFEIPMENLKPEATLFDDLQLDSLDAVDMLVHLEEKIGVKVEGERLRNVRTMQDIYNMVCEVALSSDGKSQLSH